MANDPRLIIDRAAMHWRQIAAIAITVGLNGLDGFDVLSISFASPGIAGEWAVDRAALGAVLSMELIGMAVGSILLGGVADRIGRRPTILGCLCVMTIGMLGATTATDVALLSLWRVLTGLGIGGMLAAINAVAAEFSNARFRNLALAMMVIGYPIGAVVGGSVASLLLIDNGWRSVFGFGAAATAAFIPLVWLMVPESPVFLAERRPKGALAAINRTLHRFGHGPIDALPERGADHPRQSVLDVLKPGLIGTTLLVTGAYFAHIVTFYFILKWIPKIVVDMGFAASSAGAVLVWANVGGASGGAVFGLLAQRFALRPLTIIAMLASTVMIVIFGMGHNGLGQLAVVVAAAGFFTNSGVVGLYAMFARAFPTHVRATGTGFAVGVGRGGAALAPWLAGLLFQGGLGLQVVAIIMASGSLIGAGLLLLLKMDKTSQPAG